MAIYKDPTKDDALRLDAAKAAAPYEKPKLASTELKSDAGFVRKLNFHSRKIAVAKTGTVPTFAVVNKAIDARIPAAARTSASALVQLSSLTA